MFGSRIGVLFPAIVLSRLKSICPNPYVEGDATPGYIWGYSIGGVPVGYQGVSKAARGLSRRSERGS